jgi:hypothetical protein
MDQRECWRTPKRGEVPDLSVAVEPNLGHERAQRSAIGRRLQLPFDDVLGASRYAEREGVAPGWLGATCEHSAEVIPTQDFPQASLAQTARCNECGVHGEALDRRFTMPGIDRFEVFRRCSGKRSSLHACIRASCHLA